MARPGDLLKVKLQSKFVVAGCFVEFDTDITYSFWEEGTFTIYEVVLSCPGYPSFVIPYPLKERLLADKLFISKMKDHINKIRVDDFA